MKFNNVLNEEELSEDTKKVKGKKKGWVNKGDNPVKHPHIFKTKKAADEQRKAMFANGYKG